MISLKNRLTSPPVVPLYFTAVDEKVDRWMDTIKADLLRTTTLVPENYRIGSELGVTVLIELNPSI